MCLTLDEEGVVAALPQLHHDVEQTGDGGHHPFCRQEGEVSLQYGPIVLLLDHR